MGVFAVWNKEVAIDPHRAQCGDRRKSAYTYTRH